MARERGSRVVAVGTTVVRALEAAATHRGSVSPGAGVAQGRIGPNSQVRVVDTVLSGIHVPGESHFELLRAFADEVVLRRALRSASDLQLRNHEFGDSLLIERQRAA